MPMLATMRDARFIGVLLPTAALRGVSLVPCYRPRHRVPFHWCIATDRRIARRFIVVLLPTAALRGASLVQCYRPHCYRPHCYRSHCYRPLHASRDISAFHCTRGERRENLLPRDEKGCRTQGSGNTSNARS